MLYKNGQTTSSAPLTKVFGIKKDNLIQDLDKTEVENVSGAGGGTRFTFSSTHNLHVTVETTVEP